MNDTYEVRAKDVFPAPKIVDPEDVPWIAYQNDLPVKMIVRAKPKWLPSRLWLRILKWLKEPNK